MTAHFIIYNCAKDANKQLVFSTIIWLTASQKGMLHANTTADVNQLSVMSDVTIEQIRHFLSSAQMTVQL